MAEETTPNIATHPLSTDSGPAPPAPTESKSATVDSMSGALQGPEAADPPKIEDTTTEVKTNGDIEHHDEPIIEDKPAVTAEPASTVEDTEMNDTQEDNSAAARPSSDAAVPEANGTPSSSKKANNSRRRSTGGVPEHKSKKLNKKKSAAKITHLDAQPGEYYFARLKSYPPWPSIICDEQMLPQSLLSTRPVTTKQPDGSYKEQYAEGGKRVHERTFPIMFLYTNEFAWIPNTDLTPLNPADCKEFSEKGKTKALIAAYHIAAEGQGIQYFKDMLVDHQRAMQEDLDRKEARAAAKAAKDAKGKNKRKSTDAAEDDEDVMMEDADEDEDGEAKPKSSKKRKKEIDSDGETEKTSKTPKTGMKLKLTTPKQPPGAESGKKSKDSAKASKAKASSSKKSAKGTTSDEEMTAETPKEPEKPLDPAEAKQKKEKEVLYLRHKLQKGFLSRDQAPKEEEMASMSNYIQKLEQYADLDVSIIRSTKINKVLKALIKLDTIPRDEQFNFRSRSVELLGKWNKLMGSEAPIAGPSGPGGDKDDAAPTTNGVHKEENGNGEVTDKSEKTDAPGIIEAKEDTEDMFDIPPAAAPKANEKVDDAPLEAEAVGAESEKPVEIVKSDEPMVDAPTVDAAEGEQSAVQPPAPEGVEATA